jgi:hypothetical protein
MGDSMTSTFKDDFEDLTGQKAPDNTVEAIKNLQDLAARLMKQYTFATTTKDEELFCYDSGKGIYLPDHEWLIKQQCRVLMPKIKTHEIQEVINFIKDSTYIDRKIFDSNPDVLNLANGLVKLIPKHTSHTLINLLFFL